MISASLGPGSPRPAARWALLLGNFMIGCGVMAAQGTLNDIARSLEVSIALAGQLIAIAAAVMCFGAPLLAGWAAAFDRRKLLTFALLWYATGHALCALMPSYAALLPVRAVTMLGAALFTPQAAAAAGVMALPQHRARDITFVFLGWALASVLGVPLTAWVGEVLGWRVAFAGIAACSAAAAAAVFLALPDGVRPAAMLSDGQQRHERPRVSGGHRRPVVGHREQDRAGRVIDGEIESFVGEQLEQALGFDGVLEHDLNLGGGLLDGHERVDPLA